MAIKHICKACGDTVKIDDRYAGKKIKCPRCKGITQVPFLDDYDEYGNDTPKKKKHLSDVDSAPAKKKSRSGQAQDADTDDDEPVPIRLKKGQTKSKSKLWLWLLLGGGGLFFCVIVGVAVAIFATMGWTGKAVTQESYQRLRSGMTRAEVEKILGPGRNPTMEDMQAANAVLSQTSNFPLQAIPQFNQATLNRSGQLVWRSGDTFIFLTFDHVDPNSASRVQTKRFISPKNVQMF